MPNWSDPDSIKKWLEKNKGDYGRQEQKEKQSVVQRQQQQARETPRLLQPLVTGQIVRGGPADAPRQRAEPQERRRERRPDRDDRTRVDAGPWRQGAQPGGMRDELSVPVRNQGLPGMPSGTLLDWIGQGDSPAAKYADWQAQQNRTDENPELFPGYDNVLDFTYQWFDAPTRALTTAPFIPYKGQKDDPYGLREGQEYQFSLADSLASAGQVVNQSLNPFNPNKNLLQFGENYDEARKQVGAQIQYRTDINQLPAEQREVAWRVFTSNAQSLNSPDTFETIINREEKAKEAYAKMQTAKAAGDELAAARYGQEWNRLNSLSEREIIESTQNPWAEIMFGVAVDPVDWMTGGATSLLGMTPKLAKGARAVQSFNVDPAIATKRINDVVKASGPVAEKVLQGEDIRKFWSEVMNPLARTNQAKAYLDARSLTETAMVLATGIRDKGQMQAIMEDWITTGGRGLVNGIQLAGQMADSQGQYRVGAGLLGNKEVIKRYPILAAAGEGLRGMKSLQGEGALDPAKFIPEFAKVIEDTARKAYGVSDEMNPLMKAVSWPSRFLRAILVDGYLNLAPRNWIRQAASQAANAIGDDTYSLRPIASIIADVQRRTGGAPVDMRFQSDKTFTEAGQATARHWTQMFGLSEKNPIARASRATSNVWQGDTTMLGGTVAVGEKAYYDKIWGTTFIRSFDGFWKDVVAEQFRPAVQALGLEDDVARVLANVAIEAAKTGDKTNVAGKMREAVAGMVVKDPTAARIPDELMPLELRGAINDIIQTHGPEQAAQAWAKMQPILERARRYAENAVAGGPPSWRPEFTKDIQLDDAALLTRNLTQLARKGGTGAKEAGAEAWRIAKQILRTEDNGYRSFMDDLVQTQDPKALQFGMDVWNRIYDLKVETRMLVDGINQEAIKAANVGTTNMAERTAVWQRAYQQTAQAWQEYAAKFQGVMDESRQALLRNAAGEPLPTGYDWNKVIDRYFNYNELDIAAARMADPGATWDDAAHKAAREANRVIVDRSAIELFDVLRRFPTTDSLDIITAVMRQADAMGAQTAGAVRRATEEAKATKDWDAFFTYRNQMWNRLADESVEAFAAAKRAVVWNYLAEQTPTKLRWSDPFAGDFHLVGEATDDTPGTWLARDHHGNLVRLLEEGRGQAPQTKSGATPEMLGGPSRGPKIVGNTEAARAVSGGNGVYVPKQVIEDYKALVKGNIEEIVDDVMEDVAPLRSPDEFIEAAKADPQATADAMGEAGFVTDDVPEELLTPVLDDVLEEGALAADDVPEELLTPKVNDFEEPTPVASTATTTLTDVRKVASSANIGTDQTDKWLVNSINKHRQEIGLTGRIRKLEDLSPADLPKVLAYYNKRATSSTPASAGATVEIWSDPTRKYTAQYDVVELDALVASNDASGRVNQAYPAALQPRDRSQAAGLQQVNTMAQRLDPDELLAGTNALDRGSPIVDSSGVVLSGNGRTMAMRLADDASYQNYRTALSQRAAQFGIPAARLEGMNKPVLVRRLPQDVDPVAFAQEANQRTTLAYNASESAKTLARKLTAGDLVNFDTKTTDNLRQALSLASSREFVRRVMAKIPDTERAAFVGPNGELTTQGVDTIRGALFATVFSDADAILRNYVMNPQPDLANIGNAIERTIGKLAQLQLQNPDLAIGRELADAAMTLLDVRNKGESIATVLQQVGLFGEMDEATKALVQFFDANIRTSKTISAALNRYADNALNVMGGQDALFAGGGADKLAMLQSAIDSMKNGGQDALFEMRGGLGAVKAWPDWMVPRPARRGMWHPTGEGLSFTPDGDAYASIKQGIQQARLARKSMPEAGDAALRQLQSVDKLEEYLRANLASILAGQPNKLTPAQQLQVLDIVNKRLLPAWDNVMRAASDHGRKMGEFAMMDFNDRRNIDTALALVLPFHYYFTRSAGNWMQRVMAKPALLDFWMETQRAIAGENQRTDVVDGQVVERPQRLQGTVPNPLKEVIDTPWMPDRLQNPLVWTLPFSMYMPSAFTEEIESEDVQQNVLNSTLQYLGEKTFPWYQGPLWAWMDENMPVKDGEKPRFQQWSEAQQIGDYFPLARIGAYGLQAAGQAGMQTGGMFSLGTEFDPYFVGRTIRNNTAQGNLDQATAQYAMQYADNIQEGVDPGTLIPPGNLEAAKAAYEQNVAGAGVERFGRELGGWLTGLTNQYYPEGEKEARAAAQQYREFGYGPANPGGSKAARDSVLESNPELPVGWGTSVLIPGGEGRPPGASAQISAGYDQGEDLRAQAKAEADAAVDAAILANPNIKSGELTKIRRGVMDKWQPQISGAYDGANALSEKYPIPSSNGPGNGFTYDGGMNPDEKRMADADAVFDAAYDMPGRPGEGASREETDAYYRKRDESVVAGLVALGFSEQEAASMWKERQERNYTDLEKQQREKNRIAWESYEKQGDANWGARRYEVANAYGDGALSLWEQYLDLPKGDARARFKEQYPEVDAYNLAAFEPEGFKFLSGRYGADAVLAWARTPKWTDNPGDQERRSAYLDANPKAWMVDAWVDGRPRPYDPNRTSVERNYGTDWAEAERMFGRDIWDKVERYRTATGEERRAIRDQEGLKEWLDWWYGLLPQQQRAAGSGLLPASAFRGGGGPTRNGWGGGGGGGGYGGGGGGFQPRTPYVDPQGMDRNLEVLPQYIKEWRPIQRVGELPDWFYAGDRLKPARTKWK
jgi:hypothetical protein